MKILKKLNFFVSHVSYVEDMKDKLIKACCVQEIEALCFKFVMMAKDRETV